MFGGGLIVHLNADGTLRSVNGWFVEGINLQTEPTLTEESAVTKMRQYWAERHTGIAPEAAAPVLWVFDPSVLDDGPEGGVRLVWKVEARNLQAGLDEHYYLDAQTGELVWWMNAVKNATRREVYYCTNGPCIIDTYDPVYNYIFGRSEGQPARGPDPITGTSGVDLAYDRLEAVRRYYVDTYQTDGANGAGGLGDGTFVPQTTAQVHMIGGETGAENFGWYFTLPLLSHMLDVVGHEYSHSVPLTGGNPMVNPGESGALNEGFAAIQGEGFEQYLTGVVDWIAEAEDTPPGWIPFYFSNPKAPWVYSPDRIYDRYFACDVPDEHIGAFIPMKAAFLMSVGGSFNNCSIHGIGLDRTLHIWYRAYTQYFTETTHFNAARTYFLQACKDLYGFAVYPDQTYGSPICYQVDKALRRSRWTSLVSAAALLSTRRNATSAPLTRTRQTPAVTAAASRMSIATETERRIATTFARMIQRR